MARSPLRHRSTMLGLCLLAATALGCSDSSALIPDLDGTPGHTLEVHGRLALLGQSQIRNDSLVVTLVVKNWGADVGSISYGACSFVVRAVGESGIWDNVPFGGCIDIGLGLNLGGRETKELEVLRIPAYRLRWDGAPDVFDVTIYYQDPHKRNLTSVPAGRVSY